MSSIEDALMELDRRSNYAPFVERKPREAPVLKKIKEMRAAGELPPFGSRTAARERQP